MRSNTNKDRLEVKYLMYVFNHQLHKSLGNIPFDRSGKYDKQIFIFNQIFLESILATVPMLRSFSRLALLAMGIFFAIGF